jgi:hypothetical protein
MGSFFRHLKLKVGISVVIAIVASLYKLESDESDFLLIEKKVLLSKDQKTTFDFISNLENHPTVIYYLL